jgi:putative pyrimidine permease RutG
MATETSERKGYFTGWTLKEGGIIAPDERLPWGQTILVGLQHVLAMFGSTVLAPIIMGFNPNTANFFSGIGTLIFFVMVGGRVPSYLGSRFSFIAVVLAATAYKGIVMVIGLNLAPVAINDASGSSFDTVMAIVTVLATAAVAVYAPGTLRRLPILLGGIIGYVIYVIFANGFGFGTAIQFSGVSKAAWIGLPNFTAPVFNGNAMSLIAPVAIILIAENTGHVKAVTAMTNRNLDKYLGAFLGDAVAAIVSGFGGGTGVTTYAEVLPLH